MFCYRIFGLLYLLQLFTGIDSVNIAFNKRGEFCGNSEYATPFMLDGIANFKTSVNYEFVCENPYHAFVIIRYGDLYSLQYVVVYHGEGNTEGQLNHFKGYFREDSHNTLCSEYPFKLPTPGNGMRMNCQPVAKLFPEFQLNGVHNIGFSVAEVELHTLATGLPDNKNVLIYRGCFKSFGSRDEVLEEGNIVTCQMKCLSEDKSFIGIKNNKFCACHDDFANEELLPIEICSVKCSNGVRYCGGPSSYSVYIVKPPLPWFVGCHYFSGTTDQRPDDDMTVEKCLRKCDNHAHANLRDGHFCLCGDSELPILSHRARNCDKPCTGSPSEYCGSSSYEALYATCKNRSMTCSQLFRCDPESDYDMFGKCKRCKPGFIGEYCFEVDVTPKTTVKTSPKQTDNDSYDLKKYVAAVSIAVLLCTCLACLLVEEESEEQTSASSSEM